MSILYAPRIILVKPSHPGNIGAAARSMKTMTLNELYLVSPKKFPDKKADARAAKAQDILQKAVIVPGIIHAMDNITYVFACSANKRNIDLPVFTPKTAVKKMLRTPYRRTAVLFGPENYGLSNQDLFYAHALIQIPASKNYASLNLAQAVQIIAYEYYSALLNKTDKNQPLKTPPACDPASMPALENFYIHLEELLTQIKFLNPERPRTLMAKLRRLFNRSALNQTEANILCGILNAVKTYLHL